MIFNQKSKPSDLLVLIKISNQFPFHHSRDAIDEYALRKVLKTYYGFHFAAFFERA